MTGIVVRSARRVWLAIPAWEGRLRAVGLVRPAGVLPVPGSIPVDPDETAVAEARVRMQGRAAVVIGYFGTGGRYAEAALATVARHFAGARDVAFACLGRGSDLVASRLLDRVPRTAGALSATGAVDARILSHCLQACDLLVQPYVDGVSGRRTTAVSALEHGVPIATTYGTLSEPFWRDSPAVDLVPGSAPAELRVAVERLLDAERDAVARAAAARLYASTFDPDVALAPLFAV
jgi:glycosyltransferase involved in cell wall biosynthesis